mmetsp:Transcript_1402/g.3890  ORF Transcript_1402/g.3890 Transcript_1402/m.3890 type:complete len:255 (+) Transcript_1402:932-1696(+)
MGLPCKFRSINGVSANTVAGIDCSLPSMKATILLFFSDSCFSFTSLPSCSGRLTITLLSRFNSTSCVRRPIAEGTVPSWLLDRSSFCSLGKLLDSIVGGMEDSAFALSFNCFRLAGRSGSGSSCLPPSVAVILPSWLPLADSVCSLVRCCIDAKLPAFSRFSSTLNNLSTFSLLTAPMLFKELRDRSSVVRFVNSYIWGKTASNPCSLSDKMPVFLALSNFCATILRPVLFFGLLPPMAFPMVQLAVMTIVALL